MSIGEFCNREVIIVHKDTSIVEAAQLMRDYHVGALVVVENVSHNNIPLGLVTDRDMIIELIAKEVELSTVTVGDVMSTELYTVAETTDLMSTIRFMRQKGVRRVPVVNHKKELIGLIAADDVIELIAEQLTDLTNLINKEQQRERKTRL